MIDNLYSETVEESGACLRLAILEITRYKLPFDPITYTVWYEFTAGRNQELSLEINSAKQANSPITSDMILQWFRKYIAGNQFIVAEQKTRELQAIVAEMAQYLGDSGNRIDDRGKELSAYTERLGHAGSVEEARDISRGIMSGTRDIVTDSRSLKREMDETITEIDSLKRELAGVRMAAKTDMLTGLLNRRGLEEAMKKALDDHKTSRSPLSVLMADIDHFKRINDTYGHLIGDNVLKVLAKLLQKHIKGKDIAVRFGGEEFLIILPETPLKGAFVLAEQIRLKLKSMRWRTKSGEDMGTITLSLGAAQHRPDDSMEALIQRADSALYRAKSSGRNKTVTDLDIEAA